jgi:sulfhydrogenase subunit delta
MTPAPVPDVPAAGAPAAGVPVPDVPAAGAPAAGAPVPDVPAAGADTPAAGAPAADTPAADTRPTLAVWKFASCDGCQLSLLDCEDELLALAGAVRIAHFTELSGASIAGPYDLSLVEGSVTTPDDARRIQEVRDRSRHLVTIGACATAGGIQGLRNFAASGSYAGTVYAHPEYIASLDTSTPISAHVAVDYELHGCPVDRHQLLEVLTAFLAGRRPVVAGHSVCRECKARGTVCLPVARGVPCMGPVTRAGCGARCPAVDRGCFGCFGPADTANTGSLASLLRRQGLEPVDVSRLFRTFNPGAPAFRAESEAQGDAAPAAVPAGGAGRAAAGDGGAP